MEHPLIEERCVVCHVRDDEGKMSRISYMRKTPEAWEISVKRMARLYFVSLTPEEAKEVGGASGRGHHRRVTAQGGPNPPWPPRGHF